MCRDSLYNESLFNNHLQQTPFLTGIEKRLAVCASDVGEKLH